MNLKGFFAKRQPIAPAGLHHLAGGPVPAGKRVHLRVEQDGTGLLLIDASRVLHLNPTACDYAWLHLRGLGEAELLKRIRKHYRVSRRQSAADWAAIRETLDAMLGDSEVCPITFLGLDRIEPFQTPVSAPYRLDLALTYRCNIDCAHCYNERRECPELATDDWRRIMQKAWDAGVPHVVFTGGEATLRDDLRDLIAHAQALGMVSGLLTNGVRLADRDYLAGLQAAGLDYVQVTLESADPAVHNRMVGADSFEQTVAGIRTCLELGIYTITNTTITRDSAPTLEATVRFIHSLGLKALAVNSIIYSGKAADGEFALTDEDLKAALVRVRELAEHLDLRLIWYTPTRYCRLNPLELELGPKHCTAGRYNLCVEPDGAVIPCQSYYERAGNLLTDPWEAVYNHPVMVRLRERQWLPPECTDCPELPLCGGGCPLELKDKPVACPDAMSNG
ncbi:MAG TPA: radical SAM protein [Acidobacteriota bacterium]|nr:radical SAM protein [Acidobacteriota bacterium]HQF87023.1 radical SAM protein [Acidobacteriota bacterium]HQG91584.1 radical SAM protein [Acidobacteriota bacterium]HQK86703.1 radical SAM protein [Acidobacteriota bacterium]